MSIRRRRQLRLIGDLLFSLLAIGFGLAGLGFLIYSASTPELRAKPLDNTLEPIIGHTATFLFFAAFCLFLVISALVFMRKSLRLLRDNDYLDHEDPPFADFR